VQNSIRSVYTATSSTVDLLLYYSLILDSCARNCSRAQSEKTEKRKREREGERGSSRVAVSRCSLASTVSVNIMCDYLTRSPEDIVYNLMEYFTITDIARSNALSAHRALHSAGTDFIHARGGRNLFTMGLNRVLSQGGQPMKRKAGRAIIEAAARGGRGQASGCGIARAYCILRGWGYDQDARKAFELMLACVEDEGGQIAEYLLADAYHDGEGVRRNRKKAAELYGSAASKGHGGACHMLGVMYEKGRGGLQMSKARAKTLYERAAQTGHAVSRYNVANFCVQEKKYERAIELYTASSEQGHVDAKYNLGLIYFGSQDDDASEDQQQQDHVNPTKAFALFSDASNRGHIDAQWMLAKCYETGTGTRKDVKEALRVFSLLAQHDDVDAQCKLGEIYEEGLLGVAPDKAVALGWFRKAASQGDDEAAEAIARLA
jgi:TPR repeat protein